MTQAKLAPQAQERGIALVIVLFIVVILILVAIAVLTNSSYSANDALSVQTKNQTFDAAEAGLNVAQWNLDENLAAAAGTDGSGYVNGYRYNWGIQANNLSSVSGSPNVSDPDPHLTSTISVPLGYALLYGTASSVLGGRTVYVEEMVALSPPVFLPTGAITCGKTATISHQQITDLSGKHSASILCGTIVSSGGGQIPDGTSSATGSTNDITGYDGKAYTDATPPTFLTAAQLATIQARVLQQATSGGSNFYSAADVSSGTIGTTAGDCVAYIGGNIKLTGSNSLTNYCETTVVMGNVTIGGTASYQALPPSTAHIVYVFGTGGTVLQGTPSTVSTFYVANANVTINGGGHGSFTGSVITPDSVTMNGGGTSNFYYNGAQTPPPYNPMTVVPQSKWDY